MRELATDFVHAVIDALAVSAFVGTVFIIAAIWSGHL